jgi:hypothetical protein
MLLRVIRSCLWPGPDRVWVRAGVVLTGLVPVCLAYPGLTSGAAICRPVRLRSGQALRGWDLAILFQPFYENRFLRARSDGPLSGPPSQLCD